MRSKNVVKLLADNKTISRLATLPNGEEIRIQKRGNLWRWCTYVGGKKVAIYGTLKRDKFVVTDPRYVQHARTYRRGQAVSEGIMTEIA